MTPLAFLAAVRRRLLFVAAIDGALVLVRATAAAVVLLLAAAAAGAPAWLLRGTAFVALTVAAGVTLWRHVWLPRQLYASWGAVARFVERATGAPSPGPLTSAVELAGDPTRFDDPITAALAQAAVADGVRTVTGIDPRNTVRWGCLARSLGYTVVALAAATTAAWPAPRARGRLWAALFPGAGGDSGPAAFLVGDIALTYRFPAYTGRPPVEIPGTSGDISALVGTQVIVKVRTRDDFSAGRLIPETGAAVAMKRTGAYLYEGTFTIAASTPYAFDFDGTRDARGRTIEALPDAAPVVELLRPEGEIEVQESDTVTVEYRAVDDFAVTATRLVYTIDGTETAVPLPGPAAPAASRAAAWEWALATVPLAGVEYVDYRVEALDNDTLHGPGVGRSETRRLKVFSLREQHRKLIERQDKLLENMIVLLADWLEDPATKIARDLARAYERAQNNTAKIDGLVKEVEAIRDALIEDPLAAEMVAATFAAMAAGYRGVLEQDPYLLSLVKPDAEDLKPFAGNALKWLDEGQGVPPELMRNMAFAVESRAIPLLEADIPKLLELLRKQRYDAVVQEARDLKKLREELARLLEEYKRNPDPRLKEEILKKIEKLRNEIARLMEALQSTAKEIPEDFVNPDAMKAKNVDDALARMSDKLKSNDLDAAMQSLADMEKGLEDMLARMEKSAEDLGESMFGESMKKLESAMRELEELEKEQGALMEPVEKAMEDMQKRMNPAETKRKMQQLADRARAAAEEGRKLGEQMKAGDDPFGDYVARSADRAGDAARQAADALKLPDRAGAQKAAELSESLFRSAGESLEARDAGNPTVRDARAREQRATARRLSQEMQSIAAELRAMEPDPRKLLTPQEQQAMRDNARRQEALEQQARGTEQDLRALEESMPGVPGGLPEAMGEARGAMRTAKGGMEGVRPGDARDGGRQAMDKIGGMRQQLQGMMQAMQQGQGAPMPRPGGRGRRDGSSGEVRNDRVALPGADAYRVPDELRRDILDAMGDKAPARFENQTKAYYEDLVR